MRQRTVRTVRALLEVAHLLVSHRGRGGALGLLHAHEDGGAGAEPGVARDQ